MIYLSAFSFFSLFLYAFLFYSLEKMIEKEELVIKNKRQFIYRFTAIYIFQSLCILLLFFIALAP
jgi:hypothetical protein